jgi:hypothetical protein
LAQDIKSCLEQQSDDNIFSDKPSNELLHIEEENIDLLEEESAEVGYLINCTFRLLIIDRYYNRKKKPMILQC